MSSGGPVRVPGGPFARSVPGHGSAGWASGYGDVAPGPSGGVAPTAAGAFDGGSRRRRDRGPLLLGLAAVLVVAVLVGLLAVRVLRDDAPPVAFPTRWDSRVAPLADWVADARGLAFLHPVEVDFLSEEEYQARATGQGDEGGAEGDEVEENLADSLAVLRALGLVSGDVDLAAASDDLVSGGTLAYYDHGTKRVTVRGTELTPGVRVTLVHELTHVLQDQRFDLTRLSDPDFENAATLRALAEGDAERVADRYVAEVLTADERRRYDEETAEQAGQAEDDLAEVPPALLALFTAPYVLGETVVAYHEEVAGTGAIDELLATPPSEQELLDPAVRGTPAADVVDVEVEAPDGTELVDGPASFGPVALFLMLASVGSPADALAATDGWGGDDYVAFRRGDDVCVSLAVVGDDAASTDAIGERLSSWAETSPTEAEVDQGADGVRLTSCDPGADAEAGGAVTSDLLAVPATRTAVTTSLLASGAPADRATCGGRAVVSVLTVAEMTDPDLGASAGVRARTRDAIAGCA